MNRGIYSLIALMVAAPSLAMAFNEEASYNQRVLHTLKRGKEQIGDGPDHDVVPEAL